MENKDYCTFFPEKWINGFSLKIVNISECCKEHDETLGTHSFYKCLRAKIGWFHASYITLGGAMGAWIKYTKSMIKKV